MCTKGVNSCHAKKTIVRPWENSGSDNCGELGSSFGDKNLMSQSYDVFYVTYCHMALLKELCSVPCDSLASSLWINTLMHSYMNRVNTSTTEKEKILIIDQTKHILSTYLQMTRQNKPKERDSSKVSLQDTEEVTHRRIANHDKVGQSESTNLNSIAQSATLPLKSGSTTVQGKSGLNHVDQLGAIPKTHNKPWILRMNDQPITPVACSKLLPVTSPDSGYKSSFDSSPLAFSNSCQSTPSQLHAQSTYTSIVQPGRFVLEEWYQENKDCPYASDPIVEDLASHSGMSKVQILKWLSNRRNKDGNTKRKAGRRRKNELNRAKPYTPRRQPQVQLQF